MSSIEVRAKPLLAALPSDDFAAKEGLTSPSLPANDATKCIQTNKRGKHITLLGLNDASRGDSKVDLALSPFHNRTNLE